MCIHQNLKSERETTTHTVMFSFSSLPMAAVPLKRKSRKPVNRKPILPINPYEYIKKQLLSAIRKDPLYFKRVRCLHYASTMNNGKQWREETIDTTDQFSLDLTKISNASNEPIPPETDSTLADNNTPSTTRFFSPIQKQLDSLTTVDGIECQEILSLSAVSDAVLDTSSELEQLFSKPYLPDINDTDFNREDIDLSNFWTESGSNHGSDDNSDHKYLWDEEGNLIQDNLRNTVLDSEFLNDGEFCDVAPEDTKFVGENRCKPAQVAPISSDVKKKNPAAQMCPISTNSQQLIPPPTALVCTFKRFMKKHGPLRCCKYGWYENLLFRHFPRPCVMQVPGINDPYICIPFLARCIGVSNSTVVIEDILLPVTKRYNKKRKKKSTKTHSLVDGAASPIISTASRNTVSTKNTDLAEPVVLKIYSMTKSTALTIAREISMLRRLRNVDSVVHLKAVFWGPHSTEISLVLSKEEMNLNDWLIRLYGERHVKSNSENNSKIRQAIAPSELPRVMRQVVAPSEVPRVMRVFLQLLHAVGALHNAGVIHCDLSPHNILLTGDKVTLCDFNMSTPISMRNRKNEMVPSSTIPYRSPEIVEKKMNFKSLIDVWSCGCILYEMIFAGRVLFQVHEYTEPHLSNRILRCMQRNLVNRNGSFRCRKISSVQSIHAVVIGSLFEHSVCRENMRDSIDSLISRISDSTLGQERTYSPISDSEPRKRNKQN